MMHIVLGYVDAERRSIRWPRLSTAPSARSTRTQVDKCVEPSRHVREDVKGELEIGKKRYMPTASLKTAAIFTSGASFTAAVSGFVPSLSAGFIHPNSVFK